MPSTLDQYRGALLGLALGDALGAPFEGGWLERCVWRMIGRTRAGEMRWTDDTRMTLDVAEIWLEHHALNQDHLATRFARSYQFSRGYGPSTARLLKRIRRGQSWQSASKSIHPEGSYGNGAAMRSSVLALCFPHEQAQAQLIEQARNCAVITHAHPLGIEGAVLIAVAAQLLLQHTDPAAVLDIVIGHCVHPEFLQRLQTAQQWFHESAKPDSRTVAMHLGKQMTAHQSSVTALYLALRFLRCEFRELLDFTIAMGGDVDTLAAMAGSLWGIGNGAEQLPAVQIEQRAYIEDIALQLHMKSMA